MSCNYIVTAYKPTAVTEAVVGNFTSPTDLNLIQAKGNSLVVNLVTPEGLKPVVEVSIYGRISLMQLMRPKEEPQDMLVLMTARYHLIVISYDKASGEIITRAHGDIKDRVARPTEGRQNGIVDPECRVIALHLYAGLLKVVPLQLDSGDQLTAFNIRLDNLYAIDVQFLPGFKQPTIAYLAEEPDGRVLKTFTISIKDKDRENSSWKKFTVESQASLIKPLPLPVGGALVVGAETIAYYNKEVQYTIDTPIIKELMVSCLHLVDNTRCLIGDSRGRLLMLFVECEGGRGVEDVERVKGLKLELLGEVVSPSTLAYLDNGVVFVGSTFGDPQLVKLLADADESGGYLQVLESASNIGPIVDMCVVDMDKQGQDVVVTCSGYGKDGSLRVIRSGIGINELASIDLSGVKGVWSIHTGMSDDWTHNCLVVSFVGQTTFLSLSGEEVEEAELEGLAADQQTYHCANVGGKRILQVTSQCVRLVNEESLSCVCQWEPPSGKNISTASSNAEQVVIAVGKKLFYLEITNDAIKQITEAVMEYEVACVDVTPLGDERKSSIATIGLWTDISVRVLTLPSLETIYTEPIPGDIIPRSILMVVFGGIAYLLCALGDGTLLYYQLEPTTGRLFSSKKVVLGTKPVTLKTFKSSDSHVTNVFACSNHPTIIYSNNQKLLFSNVNLKEVNYLCSLSSEAFQDCLAVVDDTTLTIGSVDDIQMLHIQSIPLGESPRRIAYQESSGTFLVASSRIDTTNSDNPGRFQPSRESVSTSLGNLTVGVAPDGLAAPLPDISGEVEVFSLILYDQNSFEAIHGYQLCPMEHALSITSCPLGAGDSQQVYYIVGTAFVNHMEREPTQGRVLVLEVTEGRILRLIHEQLRDGAVYQVVSFGGQLVISVNSLVSVASWSEDSLTLSEEAKYTNNILSLFVKTKGDFILVGDLMRSLKLLRFTVDGVKSSLTEIALDVNMNPSFLSAIEMLDDENYIGADGRHIFTCQKNTEAAVEQDMLYMSQPSRIYIGDNVNVFGRGSLVMEHPGSGPSPIQGKPLLFGTVHGAIGLIGHLTRDTFSLLSKLQDNMAKVVTSVGSIEHSVYRSFANDHKTKVAEGFIDGDLVERFLDLSQAQMNDIVAGIKTMDAQGQEVDAQIDDVIKLVEDFSRLH
ncbi:DNA damage-binding protein 1-like isoform X3 [Halichondria panicea]|uniref:DNA damage-binding protein 1-like isoform X3 n=1 Tax=Halichondria panicea TaxID=6063 RepID=UPI00312BC595